MTLPTFLRTAWQAPVVALPTDDAPAPPCPGCGTPVPARFCGECGEPRDAHDLSLGALVTMGVEHLTSLDVRLLRTCRLLVTRPGELTVEYARGIRARYTRPFQLFLLGMALMFVVIPPTKIGKAQKDFADDAYTHLLVPRTEAMMRAAHETPEQFFLRYQGRRDAVKRGLLLMFVPALGAALTLLYAEHKRFVVEHLVFATHVFTFGLLSVVLLYSLAKSVHYITSFAEKLGLAGAIKFGDGTIAMLIAILSPVLLFTWYLWTAQRRAYGASRLGATARVAALYFALMISFDMFLTALPRLTLALM